MWERPKVSVLVPVYNRAHIVRRTLDALLAQSYENLQIIVGDNQSTDGTWAVLNEYAARDKRFVVFQNSENVGAIENWRQCLRRADGEYAKVVYSDDWLSPDAIGRYVEVMERTGCRFVFSRAQAVDLEGQVRAEHHCGSVAASFSTRDVVRGIASGRLNYLASPGCILFRRNDIDRAWLHDPWALLLASECTSLGAGFDMSTVLTACDEEGEVSYVPEVLAFFGSGTANLSAEKGCHSCWRAAVAMWITRSPLPERERRRLRALLFLRTLREKRADSPWKSFVAHFPTAASINLGRPPTAELMWLLGDLTNGIRRRSRALFKGQRK